MDSEHKFSEQNQESFDDAYSPFSTAEPITLRVGDSRFHTTLSTLMSHSNSYFAKRFSGSFAMRPCKDGTYFIDRDGKHFEYILNYLRSNQTNIPNYYIDDLLPETEYYQLWSLKSQLLLKKSGSSIMKKGDIAFIHKCHSTEYYETPSIVKDELISSGPKYPAFDRLLGKRKLLFLIETEQSRSRFAIYLDSQYYYDEDHAEKGYFLELDVNMVNTGKKYQTKSNIYCYSIKFIDGDAEKRGSSERIGWVMMGGGPSGDLMLTTYIKEHPSKSGLYQMSIKDEIADTIKETETIRCIEVYQL